MPDIVLGKRMAKMKNSGLWLQGAIAYLEERDI